MKTCSFRTRARRVSSALVALACLAFVLPAAHAQTPAPGENYDDFSADPAYATWYGQTLRWDAACNAGASPIPSVTTVVMQCATLRVPNDWHAPGRGETQILLARPKVQAQGSRLLLFNSGGPDGANESTASLAALLQPQINVGQMLVAVGWRGPSASALPALACTAPPRTGQENSSDGNSLNPTPASLEAEQAWWDGLVANCVARHGDTLRGLGTEPAARDMNLVRAVLGYAHADIFAVSAGTLPASLADRLFPTRFQRIVLDSSLDWSRNDWLRFRMLSAVQYERRFDHVVAPFLARHWLTVGLGSDPAAIRNRVSVARGRAAAGGLGKVSVDMFDGYRGAVTSTFWFGLDGVIDTFALMVKAGNGDRGAYDRLQGLALVDPRTTTEYNALGMFYMCNEDRMDDPRSHAEKVAFAQEHPTLGPALMVNPCRAWPWARPLPEALLARKVDAVMVHNEMDANTPYFTAYAARQRNGASAPMVMVDNGVNHGVILDINPCAAATVFGYLNLGIKPGRDVVCGPVVMHSLLKWDLWSFSYDTAPVGGALPVPVALDTLL